MTIDGVAYTEKEPAGKALIEACMGITTTSDKPIREYMGFKMSLRLEGLFDKRLTLLLRGEITYSLDLGTDTFGNITRINHALDSLDKLLEEQIEQLDNLNSQVAAAKEELAKPFTQEDELQAKEARLALLNADLNIDGDGGLEIEGETEIGDENPEIAESVREREDIDEEVDEDEPQSDRQPYRTSDEPRYNQPNELPRTGTYGKSAPSILDDVRSIKSALKPPIPGGSKSAEIDI